MPNSCVVQTVLWMLLDPTCQRRGCILGRLNVMMMTRRRGAGKESDRGARDGGGGGGGGMGGGVLVN